MLECSLSAAISSSRLLALASCASSMPASNSRIHIPVWLEGVAPNNKWRPSAALRQCGVSEPGVFAWSQRLLGVAILRLPVFDGSSVFQCFDKKHLLTPEFFPTSARKHPDDFFYWNVVDSAALCVDSYTADVIPIYAVTGSSAL